MIERAVWVIWINTRRHRMMHTWIISIFRDTMAWRWSLLLLALLLVDGSDSAPCPNVPDCVCDTMDHGTVIDCRFLTLGNIPAITASDTVYYEMTLAHNFISTIPARAFSGLKVSKLDISDNAITSIHTDAFGGIGSELTELILHVDLMQNFPVAAIASLSNLQTLTLKGFNIQSLPPGALASLNQLQSITLESCRLSSLDVGALQGVEGSLLSLSLKGNQFMTVPVAALASLSNLQILSIAHNQLGSLPTAGFAGLSSLTELDLSSNEIATVTIDAFQGLTSLRSLSMQVNPMDIHDLAPLSALTTLEELNLGYNRIGALPNGLFTSMGTLQHLNLHGNQLVALNRVMFEGLSSLRKLLLAENSISLIAQGTFTSLPSLEELNLDQQDLSSVLDDTTFAGLEDTLSMLSLNAVSFTTNNWATLKNLAALTTLSLNSNNLPSVPDFALEKLEHLESLDLSNNVLTDVSQDAMHGPENSLKTVNLNNNQITTLKYCVFHGYSSLGQIDLVGNPLTCDCYLKWLRRWIDENYDTLQISYLQWQCAAPVLLQGAWFRELTESNLVCDTVVEEDICRVYTTTTTTTTTTSTTATTTEPQTSTWPSDDLIQVNFTNVGPSSVQVHWEVRDTTGLNRFFLEYRKSGEVENIDSFSLYSTERNHLLTGLRQEVTYVVCVTMHMEQALSHIACDSVQTSTSSENVGNVTANPSLTIILGCILGILAVIVIIGLIGFIVYRKRSGNPLWGKSKETPATRPLPTAPPLHYMGTSTKRFSKPSDLKNQTAKDLEAKLDGFSPVERDRILSMLVNNKEHQGSTLSMISTGSSHRYVAEPPHQSPPYAEGYLKPALSHSRAESPETHVYMEIPQGGATYYNTNPQPSTSQAPDPPPARDCYM